LGRSAAARAALVGLARTIGVDVPDELRFVGQVGSPDTGRPDVVGLDASSRERLLIEAKFTDLALNEVRWSVAIYARYLKTMFAWADERTVAADELEACIFSAQAGLVASQ
jgi:hypothetical protein